MSDVRPAYFIVRRLWGREVPEIYWDYLPRSLPRALTYIVRLDQLPNGADLCRLPIARLFALYRHLKAHGKLPPRWEPPKLGKAEATDA